MIVADTLLAHARGKALIGDTGYDSNRFRQAVRDRKMRAVIGSKPERPRKLPVIRKLYEKRYRVEVFFPQPEALPGHRHALREDCSQLPRAHPARVCVAMAGPELGTPPSTDNTERRESRIRIEAPFEESHE